MERLHQEFRNLLETHANSDTKEWFERYTKGHEVFLGIKTPHVESLLGVFVDNNNDLDKFEFSRSLLFSPYIEERLAGMLVLQKDLIPGGAVELAAIVEVAEQLFRQNLIRWWNSCDWFCVRVLGTLITHHRRNAGKAISSWIASDNLWQKRASLVSYVRHTREPEPYKGCHNQIIRTARTLVRSRERFHQTAVGWVLREMGKSNVAVLHHFVSSELQFFSAEGLRYATEKLPREEALLYRQQRHQLNRTIRMPISG